MPAAESVPPRLPTARPLGARPPKLYLASRSPRRRELLAGAGIEHEPVSTGVDDADLTPGPVKPEQWAAALAYLKARAGAEAARSAGGTHEFTVLGADTVCVKDGAMIGQPGDAAEARRILRLLSGGGHEVVTGVALVGVGVGGGGRAIFVDRARVRVGELGESRIDRYVASGQWRGKAGAYNLAERLADGWPIEYEGDPGTIMGLPMRALARWLPGARPVAAIGGGA